MALSPRQRAERRAKRLRRHTLEKVVRPTLLRALADVRPLRLPRGLYWSHEFGCPMATAGAP